MTSLQLVCHPSWMRDEMAAADVELHHSYGLEVPYFSYEDIWWMPQGFAVELNKALVYYGEKKIDLIAPGVDLLPSIPSEYTGRDIEVVTAQEALTNPKAGWWKSAEAKIDTFPAQYRSALDLVNDLEKAKIPLDAILYYTSTTLAISREFRSFVADGKLMATSIYLSHEEDRQITVYDGAVANQEDLDWVGSLISSVVSNCELPPSVVIDTAILATGEVILLEFNPSWCSAWYECDINAVVKTIEAGFHLDEDQLNRWAYSPDSYFIEKISRKQVLPQR